MLQPSSNPNTHMWLLELLHLFSSKYSPKELLNVHSIKQNLHNVVNELLLSITHFSAKKMTINIQ